MYCGVVSRRLYCSAVVVLVVEQPTAPILCCLRKNLRFSTLDASFNYVFKEWKKVTKQRSWWWIIINKRDQRKQHGCHNNRQYRQFAILFVWLLVLLLLLLLLSLVVQSDSNSHLLLLALCAVFFFSRLWTLTSAFSGVRPWCHVDSYGISETPVALEFEILKKKELPEHFFHFTRMGRHIQEDCNSCPE